MEKFLKVSLSLSDYACVHDVHVSICMFTCVLVRMCVQEHMHMLEPTADIRCLP